MRQHRYESTAASCWAPPKGTRDRRETWDERSIPSPSLYELARAGMRGSGNPKIPELSRLDLRTACRNNYYFCLDFLEQV